MISEPLPSRIRLHREARQGADQHGQHHRQQTDVQAVAELLPEILEVAVVLHQDHAEAVERWLRVARYCR